jgi:uncharacterized membrane protein
MAMVGRVFMASLLVVVGVQHFMYAGFVATLVPAWIPWRLFWAYFVGVAFFAAAVGILVEKLTRPAGTLLGVMFLVFVVTTHLPRIVMYLRNGNEWTSGLVALAMCEALGLWQKLPGFQSGKSVIRFSNSGRICSPWPWGIRNSAFYRCQAYSACRSAVVSGAAAVGLSDGSSVDRGGRSDCHSHGEAMCRHFSGRDDAGLVSFPACAAHCGYSAKSGAVDERI